MREAEAKKTYRRVAISRAGSTRPGNEIGVMTASVHERRQKALIFIDACRGITAKAQLIRPLAKQSAACMRKTEWARQHHSAI